MRIDLRPAPCTPDGVMKAIERFNEARRRGEAGRVQYMAIERAFQRIGWHYTTKTRCAARLSDSIGVTAAAEAFDLARSGVIAEAKKIRERAQR